MAFQITEEQKRRIEQAQQRSQNLIRQEISQFYKNIDILMTSQEKKKPDFWDTLSVFPSMGYDLLKGALDGVVGFGQSINTTIANFGNDFAHIFDESDKTSWDTDLKYTVGNLGISLAEGLTSFAVSTTANLGRVMQTMGNWEADLFESLGWDKLAQNAKTGAEFFDPKWAFGKGGVVEQTAELADRTRVNILEKEPIISESQIFENPFMNTPEENQRIVDERYYDGVASYLKGSVNVQNFIEEKITDPAVNAFFGEGGAYDFIGDKIGLDNFSKQEATKLYGDKEWYQTLSSVSESVGNILTMWAVTGLAKQALGKMATPAQIQAVGNTYFFSSTFGSMYQDAINNGTGLNDAFTYALGQAMMETLLEQTGGFKAGESPTGIFKRLQEKGITGILKDAMEEGLEEVGSELGGTGFETYNGGIEEIDNREFYSKAMFSFISGAGSSLMLGLGRNAVYNTTINTKAQEFYETYKQDASVLGQDKALSKMNKKLGKIVEGLNGNAFGIVTNDNNVSRLAEMNLEQKRAFIEKNSLGDFIAETDSGFAVKKITSDIFYNKIDTGQKDAQGNVVYENVNDEDYAINDNVRGTDITDGGRVVVTKTSELTEQGKRALKVAKDMDLPVIVYKGDTNDTGGYGTNGALYINENNLDDNNVEKTIIKHEIVHAISDTDSQVYKEIEKEVEQLITLTVVDNKANFEYKNESIKNLFRENGLETVISRQMQEYFNQNNNAVETMKLGKEEIVAYFIENLIEDTEISRMLSRSNPSLFQKFVDSFAKDETLDKFSESNPKVARQIKRIKANFERGVTRVVEEKKTIGYIMKNRAKEALRQKVMKALEEAETMKNKKGEELVKSIVDFLGLFNDGELNLKEIAKQLKVDKDFMLETILNIEMLYQQSIDDDTATDTIKQAYDTFKEKYGNVVSPKAETTEKTPEGFNIVKKRSTLDPNFLKESVIRDENGELLVLYHGTPEGFDKFDDGFIGSNTGVDNTVFGHFFTEKRAFAERFRDIKEEGNIGALYQVYLDIKNPIIHPYSIWVNNKLTDQERNKIIVDYMKATDSYEGFKEYAQNMLGDEDEGREYNDDLAFEIYYMAIHDLDFEPFADAIREKEALIKKGFDGMYYFEGHEEDLVDNPDNPDAIVKATIAFSADQVYVIADASITETVEERTIGDDKVNERTFTIGENSYIKVWEASKLSGNKNSVVDFNVSESQRRKGVGTTLIQAVIDKYKTNISAQVSNKVSLRAFYKAGFRNENNSLEKTLELFDNSPESLNMLYNSNTNNNEIVKKRSKIVEPNLTDEDRKQIKKIFSDEILSEFFTTNKKGQYILKNNKITSQSKKQNTITLGGLKYRSTEYGINAYNAVENENIDLSNYSKTIQVIRPLKISEMTEAEKALHLFFSSTRLNYILYNMNDGYGGFSVPTSKANVVFINTRGIGGSVDVNGVLNLINSEKLAEVMIHEHVHEAFKYARMDAFSYAYEFANIMFNPIYNAGNQLIKVEPTKVWEEFQKHYSYGYGGYLGYFDHYYGKKTGYVKIKTELELYNLLINSKNTLSNEQQRSINETTAQITGVVFSSFSVYKQVLQGKSTNSVKMFELYDKLMNDSQMEANVKSYLKNALKKYETLFNTYMAEISKIFPSSKKYTLQELNDFIKTFTNDKFTTKGALLTAYFQEKANKKSGDASNAVDNIIYIASIMGGKVKGAVEVFTQLEKEFKQFKNNVESLITNPESILKIDDITNIFKRIKKTDVLVRVFNKTYSGKKTYQLDEYTFVKILDEIDLLSDTYDTISDETIVMFDLPSRKEVKDALDQLEYATNEMIDQIINVGFVTDIKEFSMAIDNFKDKLKSIGNSADINSGIFGKIKKMQQALRDSNVKNILFAIQRSLKNANASYQAMSRNSQTSPNNEYLTLFGGYQDKQGIFHEGIFNRIHKVIKDNATDFGVMQQQLAPLLEEIRTLIYGSQIVGNEFAKSDDYINGDTELQNEITLEIQKVKDHLINDVLNEIYEQFAFLFNDTQFVQKQYPAIERYHHLEINEIVKEFKENKIASNLASILKEFETVFETVFSKGESLNSYAKKNTEQVEAITEQLKTKGMDGFFMRGLPPQDILTTYIEITKGKMDFFSDFFREYKKSAFMKEKVTATFDRSYVAWESAHKKNIELSTELVDIKTDFFVRMSKNKLVAIKEKAKTQINDIRAKIEVLKAEKDKLGFERKTLNKQIANEKKIKDNSKKGQKPWDDANARQRAIQTKKDDIVKKEKALKKDIDILKESIRLMNEQALIKQELIRVAEQNKNSGKLQKMQRGHIVSLYLSIVREMEMEEMAKNGDTIIQPTNHFVFGNQIDIFDNQLMEQKGYKYAKKHTIGFTIFSEAKQDMLDYLESLLTEEDLQNIDFAKTVFDQNYEFANQMYKEKYLVELPRQQTYIPFSTKNADKSREFELKRINRNNVGVDRGFILKTTLGASEDLQMENIFSVMHNHTRTVANYSFDRLNTDFQNLLVNKAGGTSFQSLLSNEDTILGVDNGVEQNINTMLMNIAQYNDINEAEYVKAIRKVLRNTVRAVIGLAIPMYIKQYLSMITISSKNKINFLSVVKNASLSTKLNNKYFKYLMQHNDNFYFRAKNKFIPNLSDYASVDIFGHKNKWLNKAINGIDDVSSAMTTHVGRADARVLVGAFRAKAEEIRKRNPQLHEDDVLAQANEWLTNEVLLFGVANTNPAFRSNLSNSKNLVEQIAGKFQSENLIHYGSIVRDIMILKNGHKGQFKTLSRDLLAFFMSGLFSALVNQWWGKQMGYDDDVKAEDEILDFVFNEFLWDNMIGSIPYINQLTQMWRWNFDQEKGTITKDGFDPRVPLLSEFLNITKDFSSIVFFNPTEQEKEKNARKYYEIIEEMMYMFGIPIKNAKKIGQLTSNIMGEYGSKQGRELDMLFNNKTRSVAYYDAIKAGDREEINGYVADRFDNLNVQNEIVRLNMENNTVKIYDVTYFKSMDEDGKYQEFSIPQEVSDKYKTLTQRALVKMFRSSSYRKLPDNLKAKALQRVINYYYNYMKASILYDMKKGDKPNDINSIDEVSERSLEYSIKAMEE